MEEDGEAVNKSKIDGDLEKSIRRSEDSSMSDSERAVKKVKLIEDMEVSTAPSKDSSIPVGSKEPPKMKGSHLPTKFYGFKTEESDGEEEQAGLQKKGSKAAKKIRIDGDEEDSADRSKESPSSDSEREPQKRRSARLADKRSKEPEEKEVANEDLPFHCPICHKGFQLEAAMKRHRRYRCGRRYTVTPSYVRHFACPFKGDTGMKTKSGCRRVDTDDSASKAQKKEGEKRADGRGEEKAKTIQKSKKVAPQVTVIDLTGRDSDEESRGEVAVDGGGEKAKTNDKPKKVAPEMIDLTEDSDEPLGEMAGDGGKEIGIASGEATDEESMGDA